MERALRLESQGSIKGTVRKADGTAAKDVRVELVRILPDGKLAKGSSLWAETKADGQFSMRNVPAGEFVVGLNVRSPATAAAPWDTVSRELRIEPNQAVDGVDFQLPAPLAVRTVQVRVFWADGTPAVGARAHAEVVERPDLFGDSTEATDTHMLDLRLMQHYAYRITADWFAMTTKGHEHIRSKPYSLPPGKEAQAVDIRLEGNRPSRLR